MNTIPPTNNPYNIPADYFTHLADEVMAAIRHADLTEPMLSVGSVAVPYAVPNNYWTQVYDFISLLPQQVAAFEATYKQTIHLPYSLPEGYFDHVTSQVMHRIHHTEEDMVDTSFIDALGKENPYTIDATYFDELAASIPFLISEDIADDDQALKAMVGQDLPYQMPADYFSEIAVDGDHLLKATIGTDMPYQVPQGYFTQIDARSIIQLKRLTDNAKQYRKPVIKSLRMVKWAAAASLLLIFGLGMFWISNDNVEVKPHAATTHQLSLIPKDEITQYIKNNIDDFDMAMLEKVSIEKNIDMNNSDKLLDEVNEDDIKEFLELEGI